VPRLIDGLTLEHSTEHEDGVEALPAPPLPAALGTGATRIRMRVQQSRFRCDYEERAAPSNASETTAYDSKLCVSSARCAEPHAVTLIVG
jgi:hypothetical protein